MTQTHYYRKTHIRKIRTKRGTKFVVGSHKKIRRPKGRRR